MTSKVRSGELDEFLRKFPETRFMDIFAPDINGILHGKRIQTEEFPKVFGNGSNFVASTPLLNVLGDIPKNIGYGNDDGDPDLKATAVPGSLAPVPWARLPTAQCLLELSELDGTPFFLDPRNVLRKALRPLQDMGLNNVCDMAGGFEAWKKAGGATENLENTPGPDERATNARQTLKELGHKGRLAEQIAFILEIDKLKQVFRQTPLIDYSRKENDAEHSWQLAMMALVLSEYAPAETVPLRVLKMVLIHDIVEIDAGDSPAYSGVTKADQFVRETIAADRLFGLLPADLSDELRALWDEFEQKKSPDALFARAMDRLQPFLHNYFTDGKMWMEHKIRAGQVRERMAIIGKSAPQLLELVEDLIVDAVAKGYLRP